jgi:hypothetical protein
VLVLVLVLVLLVVSVVVLVLLLVFVVVVVLLVVTVLTVSVACAHAALLDKAHKNTHDKTSLPDFAFIAIVAARYSCCSDAAPSLLI